MTPDVHHRDLESPCAGCGARWERDGTSHVLNHNPGCLYLAALDEEDDSLSHHHRKNNVEVKWVELGLSWVPPRSWAVINSDTGECYAWHRDEEVARSLIPTYERFGLD